MQMESYFAIYMYKQLRHLVPPLVFNVTFAFAVAFKTSVAFAVAFKTSVAFCIGL